MIATADVTLARSQAHEESATIVTRNSILFSLQEGRLYISNLRCMTPNRGPF